MRDQIECIQNLVVHMQADLDEINERCKIALNTMVTVATIAQQPQAEIKCVKCEKVLPPLEVGEGPACPTGYLCRKCFGL